MHSHEKRKEKDKYGVSQYFNTIGKHFEKLYREHDNEVFYSKDKEEENKKEEQKEESKQ